MSIAESTATDSRFVHPALFYRSDAEYLDALVPFIGDGVGSGQPVAVAVPTPRLELLRHALGAATRRCVTMVDMAHEGRNPGRIIARVLRRFADGHTDRHVRIVGEPIWPGRTHAEYPACVQHESLINSAFAGRDVTILCPYDATALAATTIADARATHPVVWEDGRPRPSGQFAPDAIHARYNRPLPAPSDHAVLPISAPTGISHARRFATEHASRFGLSEDRVPDLELIASELVTNSFAHTPGPCRLSIWREDGHLVCEVRDKGQLTDPLAGRRPSRPHQRGGWGLLLVNDLADLVRIHTSPHGTTIRALLRLG